MLLSVSITELPLIVLGIGACSCDGSQGSTLLSGLPWLASVGNETPNLPEIPSARVEQIHWEVRWVEEAPAQRRMRE